MKRIFTLSALLIVASSFTFNSGPPAAPNISGVTIAAGNYKIGDPITVTILADGTGYTLDPSTVNGVTVTGFTDLTNNNYTVTYTVVAGNTDRASVGVIPININLRNGAGGGNLTTYTTAPTSGGTVTIDANAPTITLATASPSTGTAKIGDMVTITVTAGGAETGLLNNGSTINGQTTTFTDNANGTYSFGYSVASGNTNWTAGNLPFNIVLKDAAGNASTARTTYSTANTLAGDANAPTITLATASPSTGTAKVGDVVTITVTAGGAETGLLNNGSTINGQTTTFTDNANGTYSFGYTVANGNTNWTAGNLPFNILLKDAAGNSSAARTTYSTANTLAGDANAPTITLATASPSTGTAKIGDVITITVTAGGNETGLTQGTSTINSQSPTSFLDNGDGTYNFTYTVVNGNTDWTAGNLPFSIKLNDAAGNASAARTTFSTANTLAGDANAPNNENTVFNPTIGAAATPGGTVTLAAGNASDFNFLAPASTTNFVANGTTITSAAGNATSIVAPSNTGTYYLYVVDAAGNYSVASTKAVTVMNQAAITAYQFTTTAASTTLNFGWTTGGGTNRIVLVKTSGAAYTVVNGTTYTANLAFGSGSDLNGGAAGTVKCVYNGNGSALSANVTGLTAATTYTVEIYEYVGSAASEVYLSPPASINRSTQNGTNPTTASTALVYSSIGANTITVQFTQGGNGSSSVLVARAGSAVTFTPADGVTYTTNLDYSAGTDLGSGDKIIAIRADGSSGTPIVITGLNADTQYFFKVYEMNGTAGDGSENYSTVNLAGSRNTTPSAQATSLNFTSVGQTSMTLNWTNPAAAGGGDRRIVVMRQGTPVATDPTNQTAYTSNAGDFAYGVGLPAGSQVGAGYVMYDGTGNSVPLINLLPNTTYYFAIYEYNSFEGGSVVASTSSAAFLTPSTATANQGTTADATPPTTNTVSTLTPGAASPTSRVVAGYWNSTNTNLTVRVPLQTTDGTLDGGHIQIRISNTTTNVFVDVLNSGYVTILSADRTTGYRDVVIAKADLIAATANAGADGYREGAVGGTSASETRFMEVTAVVSDLTGNSVTYTKSASKLDVDTTPPSVASGPFLYSNAGINGTNHEVVQLTLNEAITLVTGDVPLSTNTGGASGFYLNGDLGTTFSVYDDDGTTNSIDNTLTNTHLIYLESSANTSGWTTSTPLVYTKQTSYPGAGLFIKDAAGNEMGAFSTNPSTGTTTSLGTASNGLATSPIASGSTGAVFAFSLTSTGTVTLTGLTIEAVGGSPLALMTNFKLYANSGIDNLAAAVAAGQVNSSNPTVSSSSVTFSAGSLSTVTLSATAKYFYLVCDVDPYFSSASPAIQFRMLLANNPFSVNTGGKGGADQTGTAYTLHDGIAPTISSISLSNPTKFNTTNTTQIVTVKYNEPMDNTSTPSISFSASTWSSTPGAWSTTTLTNDTYTQTFTYTGSNDYNASVTASVTGGGKDWGGNTTTGTSSSFVLDTQNPTISNATAPSQITTNALSYPIVLVFSERMDTSTPPTITFSAPLNTQMSVSVAGTWSNTNTTNDTYSITYLHDGTSEELAATVNGSGAKDFNGNLMVPPTPGNITVDTKRPTVSSINRASSQFTKGPSVSYTVTFSEKVNSVDETDFVPVAINGTVSTGTIPLGGVSTSDNITYTVVVQGLTGDGDTKLRLAASPTITDIYTNALTDTTTTHQIYTIDNTPPVALTIDISSSTQGWSTTNATSASTLTWLVTFKEPVTGVDSLDFSLNRAKGTDLTFTTPIVVTGSGTTWTVTLNNVKLLSSGGSAQLDITLNDNNTILDLAGNQLGGPLAGDGNLNPIIQYPGSSSPGFNDYYTVIYPLPSQVPGGYTASLSTPYSFSIDWTSTAEALIPASDSYFFVELKESSVGSFNTLTSGTYPYDTTLTDDGRLAFVVSSSIARPIDIKSYLASSYGKPVKLNSGENYDVRITPVSYSGFYNSQYHLYYATGNALPGTGSTTISSSGTLALNSTGSSIKSTNNSAATGVSVLKFDIKDDGSNPYGDNAAFKFSKLTVNSGNATNWSNALAGASLSNGTDSLVVDFSVTPTALTSSSIIFGIGTPINTSVGKLGYVADDATTTYKLRVWLKTNLNAGGITDGTILSFVVDNSSFTYDNASILSSQLTTLQSATANVPIDIQASKLVEITPPPASIGLYTNFRTHPVFQAQDAYGNLDLTYNSSGTISNTKGFGQSTNAKNFSNGVLTLNPFYFTQTNGTSTTISITAPGVTGVSASVAVTPVISSLTQVAAATVAPTSFSSLTTTPALAVQNFDFKISDDVAANTVTYADNDSLPTIVKKIRIYQGSFNSASLSNWTKSIAGAQLNVGASTVIGTVKSDSLVFDLSPAAVPSALKTIADGTSTTYGLKIWLLTTIDSATADVIDNQSFDFKVDRTTIMLTTSSNVSSTLQTTSTPPIPSSGSGKNMVTVAATKLHFSYQPASGQNYDAPLLPVATKIEAQATDANGNLDADYNASGLSVTTTAPGTAPLNNTTITNLAGILKFDVNLLVSSSGSGGNGQTARLVIKDTNLPVASQTANSNLFTLQYEAKSDIIKDPGFKSLSSGGTSPNAYRQNILYAGFQSSSFSGSGTPTKPGTVGARLERFLVRDGGSGLHDNDGTTTKLQTLTLNLFNWQDLRTVALYADSVFIGEQAVSSINPNFNSATGDLLFTGLNAFVVGDDSQKALTVYTTFNSAVTDNQIIQVKVTNVTAAAVSSSFIAGGTSTSFAALGIDDNQIEVVATQLDITSPALLDSIYLVKNYSGIVVKARDASPLSNLDLDFNGIITSVTNTAGDAMNNGTIASGNNGLVTGTTAFSSGVYSFPSNFQFISGKDLDNVTLKIAADKTGGNNGTSCGTNAICSGISPVFTLRVSAESSIQLDPTFKPKIYPTLPNISYINYLDSATFGLTTNGYELTRALVVDGSKSGYSYKNSGALGINYLISTGSDAEGNGNGDKDGAGSLLTKLSLRVYGASSLSRIALYDSTGTLISTVKNVSNLNLQRSPVNGVDTVSTVFTWTGNLLTANDNGQAPFSVRVSFKNSPLHIRDLDSLQVRLVDATLGQGNYVGSQFYKAGVSGYVGGDNKPPKSPVGLVDVIATSLDFTVQPSTYAGINEPVGNVSAAGAIIGGSGYQNGTYPSVQLVVSTGSATTAPIADVTIAGGKVTNVVLITAGQNIGVGSTFSCPNSKIGGTGSGWSVAISSTPYSYGPAGNLKTMPATQAGVVTARDAYSNIDTDFSPSTITVKDANSNVVPLPTGRIFQHGVLDLNGMTYPAKTVNNTGNNGTLNITAGSISNSTVACTPVNVTDVSVHFNANGLVATKPDNTGQANLKGGKTGLAIFGLSFKASGGIGANEPKVNKFIIGFKTGSHTTNTSQWYYNSNTNTSVFNNLTLRVNFKGYDVASNGGSVTPFASTVPGEYDWIIVDVSNFSAVSGAYTNSLAVDSAEVQLIVDVSSTTSGATQHLVPYLVDDGYSTSRAVGKPEYSVDYSNVLVSKGTGQSIGYNTNFTGANTGQPKVPGNANEIDGFEYNFASATPPKLLADKSVYPSTLTSPYTPQSNVDPVNLAGPVGKPQIVLAFDTKVGVLDNPATGSTPTASLYLRSNNARVADLYFDISGTTPGQVQAQVSANGQTITSNSAVYDRLVFNVCAIGQPGVPAASLNYDDVYYVQIVQGSYDQNKKLGAGIADLQLNFFGGVSDNFTLYFKTWSNTAPNIYDVKNSFSTINYGSISATFDQLGTAYFLVVPNPSTAPTAAQIKSASVTHVNTINKVAINQIGAAGAGPSQVFSFPIDPTLASLPLGGHDYDVYIYTENNAGSPIPSAVYSYPLLIKSTAEVNPGTVSNTIPTVSIPQYKICPDSYTTLTQPIVLMEGSGTGTGYFQLSGDQIVNILLPPGYEFDTKTTPQIVIDTVSGNDFINLVSVPAGNPQKSKKVASSYSSNSILRINFNNSTNLNYDVISISGLRVIGKRDPLTGTLPVGGNIYWFYGHDAITNNHPGSVPMIIATISPLVPSKVPDFFNYYWYYTDSVSKYHTRYTGNALLDTVAAYYHVKKKVNAIPLNYTSALASTGQVRLVPNPTSFAIKEDYLASTFSGSGVSGDLLTLSAVTKDAPFNITMSHTDVNGCAFTQSNQYVVYDPNSPISPNLGAPNHLIAGSSQAFTAGTVQDIMNGNFNTTTVSNLTTKVGDADSLAITPVTQADKAGYTLLELQSDLPVSEIDLNNKGKATQLISGPAWRKVVQHMDSIQSNSPNTYFKWDYAYILNGTDYNYKTKKFRAIGLDSTLVTPVSDVIQKGVNGGFTRVYDYFKKKTPSNSGNYYWSGGTLGKVEFTGLYQNTADNSVFVPFRQQVELFVPAVPIIEVTSVVSSNDSSVFELNYTTNNGANNANNKKNAVPTFNSNQYPKKNPFSSLPSGYLGTSIFCKNGGLISLNAYPVATSTAKGYFGVYDLYTYNFTTNTGTSLASPTALGPFVDNGNGTMTLDPSVVFNSYNDILITYTYQEYASPSVGVGYLIIRVTPNPVAGFNMSSNVAAAGQSGASKFDALCAGSPITFDGGSASSILQATGVGNTAPNSNSIVNYTWDFGDVNSGASNKPLGLITKNGVTSLDNKGGGTNVRIPLYFNGLSNAINGSSKFVQSLPPAFIAKNNFGYADGTYTQQPLVYYNGSGSGSGATADIVVLNHKVVSVNLTNPGNNLYAATDSLTVTASSTPNLYFDASVPVGLQKPFRIAYGSFIMNFDKPWHYYASATAQATVKLDLISNWGCPSLSKPINLTTNKPTTNTPGGYMKYLGSQADIMIGDTGSPDFTFTGNCASKQVKFTYVNSTSPVQGYVAAYSWDFNLLKVNGQLGATIGYNPSNDSTNYPPVNVLFDTYATLKSPKGDTTSFKYNKSGIYTVQLTTTTILGCKISVSKTLGQLTTIPASVIDFTKGDAGFLPLDISAQGVNQKFLLDGQLDGTYVGRSSWKYDSTSTYQRWSTIKASGSYYPGEFSALYTACLDVQIPRPMISFDATVDLSAGGLVLQYSDDPKNILDPTKTWTTLGADQNSIPAGALIPGIDWYNGSALSPNPGSYTINSQVYGINQQALGWTGTSKVLQPKHALDSPNGDLTTKNQPIQLRFAFAASSNTPLNGIKIDNIQFGSRTRTIMLENFTSTNGGADATLNGKIKSDADFISSFVKQNINSTQLVNVNYHVGFLGLDPFYQANSADPSARVLYYGVSQAPYAFFDGKHDQFGLGGGNPLFQAWGQGTYDLQTLKLAQADFGLDYRTGTISTQTNSVTGVGTKFMTELSKNDTIYNGAGILIGVIANITSDTKLTLSSNAAVAVSGGAYAVPSRVKDLNGTYHNVVPSSILTNDGSIHVNVNVTPNMDLPETTTLHVLVLEDTVSATKVPSATAIPTNQQFEYVLRKMLPDGVGTKFPAGTFISGKTVHLSPGRIVNDTSKNFSWVIDKPCDSCKYSVVIFLQDEVSKDIYQADLFRNVPYPTGTITAIEPTAENLKVYPNPADQEVTILLPSPAKEVTSIRMANQLGQFTECGQFAEGEQMKTISTGTLSEGVYILQLGSSKNAVRTKVIVVHK